MPYTQYHPVYLDLNGRSVLIVGGGPVALEKLESLKSSGAKITLVSPEAIPEVAAWAGAGKICWERRPFADVDIDGVFMAIAATDDPELNGRVFRLGDAKQKLTNSVDDPQNCNFIMAAIAGRGPLQVAVSSAGCSPAMAQRIRNRIADELLTEEAGALTELLGDWRPEVKRSLSTYKERQRFWEHLLTSAIGETLLTQGREAADETVRRELEAFAG